MLALVAAERGRNTAPHSSTRLILTTQLADPRARPRARARRRLGEAAVVSTVGTVSFSARLVGDKAHRREVDARIRERLAHLSVAQFEAAASLPPTAEPALAKPVWGRESDEPGTVRARAQGGVAGGELSAASVGTHGFKVLRAKAIPQAPRAGMPCRALAPASCAHRNTAAAAGARRQLSRQPNPTNPTPARLPQSPVVGAIIGACLLSAVVALLGLRYLERGKHATGGAPKAAPPSLEEGRGGTPTHAAGGKAAPATASDGPAAPEGALGARMAGTLCVELERIELFGKGSATDARSGDAPRTCSVTIEAVAAGVAGVRTQPQRALGEAGLGGPVHVVCQPEVALAFPLRLRAPPAPDPAQGAETEGGAVELVTPLGIKLAQAARLLPAGAEPFGSAEVEGSVPLWLRVSARWGADVADGSTPPDAVAVGVVLLRTGEASAASAAHPFRLAPVSLIAELWSEAEGADDAARSDDPPGAVADGAGHGGTQLGTLTLTAYTDDAVHAMQPGDAHMGARAVPRRLPRTPARAEVGSAGAGEGRFARAPMATPGSVRSRGEAAALSYSLRSSPIADLSLATSVMQQRVARARIAERAHAGSAAASGAPRPSHY